MSPTKRTSTTKRTSRPNRKLAWKTTWQDTPGVRHHALAQPTKDRYLVNVFTPCEGFINEALDNTDDAAVVTCLSCVHSRFAVQCDRMDQEAIEHLDDDDLLAYFLDHDAMAITFQPT